MPSVRIQISLSGEEDGDKVKKGPHSATKKVHGGKQYERSKLMEALMYEITKQTKGEGPLIHTKQIPECQISTRVCFFLFLVL